MHSNLKQLRDNFFTRLFKKGNQPTIPPGGNIQAQSTGRVLATWNTTDNKKLITNGYDANDSVYSCVTMVMDKAKAAPWGVYKIEDEKAYKSYLGLLSYKGEKNFKEIRKLREKALVLVENFNAKTGELNSLLQWPNEFQTFEELISESIGWQMILGNAFWIATDQWKTDGDRNGVPMQIHLGPAQYMQVVAGRLFPPVVIGYELQAEQTLRYDKSQVLHIKHWNPNFDMIGGAQLYGKSPLKSASRIIDRDYEAQNASVAGLQNGGSDSIIFLDLPGDGGPSAADRIGQINLIKQHWEAQHAGSDKHKKKAFSGYPMGVAKVTDSLVDMNLSELEVLDMRKLCNIWGIPSQLMNDPANKVYNNSVEGEKALTSRCVLPRLNRERDNFNRKLKTDWGFKKDQIVCDYDATVFTELQEDSKQKWGWVRELPMSWNDKLDMMGIEKNDNPAMDEIYLPSGFVNINDVGANITDEEIEEEIEKGLKLKAI